MVGVAGSSYALFAGVWTLMCVVCSALVIDAMLRNGLAPSPFEAERSGDAPLDV